MTALDALDSVRREPAVRAVREALGDAADRAWIVGGTIRDALLGRPVRDVDLAVADDAEGSARAVARRSGGPVFPLSEAFGAWRAVAGAGDWVCDVAPLHGEGIESDLARRDFSVNAMAMPLAREGGLVDPHGGVADLERGVLRVLGSEAYASDPLRPLRLARLAAELPLRPDDETERLTAAAAPRVSDASPERVFSELRRLVGAEGAVEGLELAGRLGLTDAVLPEVAAMRGVEQSQYHHLDVYEHTLEVFRRQIEVERTVEDVFPASAEALRAELGRPLADELTRWEALRLGALLHDVGKPRTRGIRPDGRVTFIGHDSVGAEMVRSICRRLRASDRMTTVLSALTRHHLVLGFLVHERPLPRRTVYAYLRTCDPVEVEVTILSCADRLATRGRGADSAIARHLELARELLPEALAWRESGPPRAPIRGDVLAEALGIPRGRELGDLLARLAEATFAGEVETADDAIQLARRLRENAVP